jgi:hypothetical protein
MTRLQFSITIETLIRASGRFSVVLSSWTWIKKEQRFKRKISPWSTADILMDEHAAATGRNAYSHLVLMGLRSMVRRYLSLE